MINLNNVYGNYIVTDFFDLNELIDMIRKTSDESSLLGIISEDYLGDRPDHEHPEINFRDVYKFKDKQKVTIESYISDDYKFRIIKKYDCCNSHTSELVVENEQFQLFVPYITKYLKKI